MYSLKIHYSKRDALNCFLVGYQLIRVEHPKNDSIIVEEDVKEYGFATSDTYGTALVKAVREIVESKINVNNESIKLNIYTKVKVNFLKYATISDRQSSFIQEKIKFTDYITKNKIEVRQTLYNEEIQEFEEIDQKIKEYRN